jgi:serine/threonine protein kinase
MLSLLMDVASALEYLASLPVPIVHRDVNPCNVFISGDGLAVLSEFGVAKSVSEASVPKVSEFVYCM